MLTRKASEQLRNTSSIPSCRKTYLQPEVYFRGFCTSKREYFVS